MVNHQVMKPLENESGSGSYGVVGENHVGAEIISGALELVSVLGVTTKLIKPQKVLMVVYKTSNKHFAILYPWWGLSSARKVLANINLLTSEVRKSSHRADEFSIKSSNCDERCQQFTFRCLAGKNGNSYKNNNDINVQLTTDSWLAALMQDYSCLERHQKSDLFFDRRLANYHCKSLKDRKVCSRQNSLSALLEKDDEVETEDEICN